MGSFAIRDSKFIYSENSEEILLDLNDYFSNKGRVPFHSDLTDVTVPNLIVDLMDAHETMCGGSEETLCCAYYTLMDVMFIREHVKSKYPKAILVITGREKSILVEHISFLLDHIQPESEVYCIDCSEGADALLQGTDESFDMVIVDGITGLNSGYEISEEAHRLVKTGGFTLGYFKSSSSLCDAFETTFRHAKKYSLNDSRTIFAEICKVTIND